MEYSIQNSSGKVYGFFNLPQVGMSAEVWAEELEYELAQIGILGINGVREKADSFPDGHGGYVKSPRVVIDIDVWSGNEDRRVEQVHETIGRIACEHYLPES